MQERIEYGSNIFEMIEFVLNRRLPSGEQKAARYGVNVAKVREVIRMPKIDPLGTNVKGLAGLFELRGVAIPAINLCEVLGDQPAPIAEDGRVLVAEFSNKRAGFIINEANRIRRVDWDKVQPPSGGPTSCMTGMVLLEDSEFLFILDLEKIVTDIEQLAGLGSAESQEDSPLLGPKGNQELVMLVEDSPIIMNNVKKQLIRHGYKVVTAENGQEAWDKLNAGSVSIAAMVSDIEMPKMDGLTLLKKMNGENSFKEIPKILHSSLASQSSLEAGSSVGACGYVVKNDFQTLFSLLHEVLSEKAA